MRRLKVSSEGLEAVETYTDSIHGKAVALGSEDTADCISCHATSAVHDIYRKEDINSTVHKDNKVKTCRQCHKNVNERFVQIDVHSAIERHEKPLLYFMTVGLTFVFYGSVSGLIGLMIFETFRRKKAGVKMQIRRGTSWRGISEDKEEGESHVPGEPKRLEHPKSVYVIGSTFKLVALAVFVAVLYQVTFSPHGPAVLVPIKEKIEEQQRSAILDEVRRNEEHEKHRHFHNVVEIPRLPENMRPVCYICHSNYPHGKNKKVRALLNMHSQFVVCETCHIDGIEEVSITYKWYNPFTDNPEGPFFGTSYDLETGRLLKVEDKFSKIAPYLKMAGKLESLIQMQDAPLAQDYMKVRDKLTPDQRDNVKKKFHVNIKPKGNECKECHSRESILHYRKLGFASNRTIDLEQLNLTGMITKYEKFYIPDLFK
jgi:nitrate/TMAO reductase-like tetraheme cytochrome c subunit